MCKFLGFVCVGKVELADVDVLKVCGEVRGTTVSVLVLVLALVVVVSFIMRPAWPKAGHRRRR